MRAMRTVALAAGFSLAMFGLAGPAAAKDNHHHKNGHHHNGHHNGHITMATSMKATGSRSRFPMSTST